jgi:hypothetical protein
MPAAQYVLNDVSLQGNAYVRTVTSNVYYIGSNVVISSDRTSNIANLYVANTVTTTNVAASGTLSAASGNFTVDSSGAIQPNGGYYNSSIQQVIDNNGTVTLTGASSGLQNQSNQQVIDNNGTATLTGASSGLQNQANQQVIDNNGTVTLTGASSGLQNQANQQIINNNGTVTLTAVSSGLYNQSNQQVIDNNGNITSPGTVSGTTLYGDLAGSNAVSGSSISGTTLYGDLAGSNTVNASTVTATTHYGALAGSNTVNASTVTATTHYGALAGSNTISGTSITANTITLSNTITGNIYAANAVVTTNVLANLVQTANGLYVTSTFSGTYTDGLVMDYKQGAVGVGRVSVGPIDNFYFMNGGTTAGNVSMVVTYSNSVGVGTTSPTANLHLVGNIYASNALQTTNVVASGIVSAGAQVTAFGKSGSGVCAPVVYRQGGSATTWNSPGANTSTYAVTSGAVQIQCGANTAPATTQFIPYPVAYTNNPIVILTSYGPNGNIWVSSVTSASFQITANAAGTQFEWMSIGI